MKYLSAILLCILIMGNSYGQRFKTGLGLTINEVVHYNTPIDLDSLVIYQRSQYEDSRIVPFIHYVQRLSNKFDISGGVQIHNNFAGVKVEKRATPLTPENIKQTNVGIRSFEFPISGHYVISNTENFNLKVFVGLTPIFNRIKFESNFEPGDQFPKSITDILNKAGTLPKRFHVDYQYGLSFSYNRFGIDIYQQQNLTGNLNNNLEIWDNSFLFTRTSESIRLMLSYTFPLFPN